MAAREGEISISTAATVLECHVDTVTRWAKRAMAGERTRLGYVRRDVTGHYWLSRDEVHQLCERLNKEEDKY